MIFLGKERFEQAGAKTGEMLKADSCSLVPEVGGEDLWEGTVQKDLERGL